MVINKVCGKHNLNMFLKTLMIDVIILRININKQMFTIGKICISVRFVEKEILELTRSEGCGVRLDTPSTKKPVKSLREGGVQVLF